MEEGCAACGTTGDAFYLLQYYILPTKKVRKKHRDKAVSIMYCRTCYENDSDIQFSFGGEIFSFTKTPRHLMAQFKPLKKRRRPAAKK